MTLTPEMKKWGLVALGVVVLLWLVTRARTAAPSATGLSKSVGVDPNVLGAQTERAGILARLQEAAIYAQNQLELAKVQGSVETARFKAQQDSLTQQARIQKYIANQQASVQRTQSWLDFAGQVVQGGVTVITGRGSTTARPMPGTGRPPSPGTYPAYGGPSVWSGRMFPGLGGGGGGYSL